jgi:hypothetical protein
MRKVLELSEETYQQLATLAAYQQRPLDAVDEVDDDFEPEVIPGKPLSEVILEERR